MFAHLLDTLQLLTQLLHLDWAHHAYKSISNFPIVAIETTVERNPCGRVTCHENDTAHPACVGCTQRGAYHGGTCTQC
ncbi:hypothetical protein PR001_g2731 [Phytophthora rubi]|uniref:Laminin EGF-like domain-containing protein n=1 Tax=Phytophthora rubi TaxID=129364 RepID=A0A6A3NPG9_9STRA|nr:hypothetical protein PR002_g2303 [Phytophthora rubi]KAE9050059.1 hypothetical protein PR001_g2731 [Phytophthora rubi]